MPSTLLDAFGRPAHYTGGSSTTGLYAGVDGDSRTRPAHPDMFADFARLLPRITWRRALSDCRWITTAFPLVTGAAVQKADYASASHWRTYYQGRDTAWGDYAEQYFADIGDKICTTRKPLFNWRSLWWSGSIVHDTDGSFFINLTESAGGFPQLQPIEAHRVGSWECLDSTVRGGAYDGARIQNGIIYDRAGNEIAYRVLQSDSAYDLSKYTDVSARDMVHIPGRVLFFSEGRPLPRIAPALIDLYMAQDTRASEQIAQNVNSRLTLIEKNESGKRDPVRDLVNGAPQQRTAAGTDTELVEKGFWRYVKNGGNLEAHESSRPSDQWDRFDSKVTATALYAMGWRLEMFDLAKLGGAAVHGFADQINTPILGSFHTLAPHVLRCRAYLVAKLIKRGDLPENSDWWRWGLQEPPEFTGNQSRAVQADLDAVRAGAQSMPEVQRRWGKRPREVLQEQAAYLKMRREVAADYKVNESDLGRTDQPGDAPSAEVSSVPSEE